MSAELVLWEQQDDFAVITLNRPPMNPLSSGVFQQLEKMLLAVESNPSIKSVIFTSSGAKAFCTGIDIAEIKNLSSLQMYEFCLRALSVLSKIENLTKPTIAVVNGLALGGGCELALTCDFRLAGENARFAQPEINLGIIPGGGGTQRLPRLIGMARAKELLFLGEMIDAVTAKEYGLVNNVLPEAELMPYAEQLAKKLASKPAVAMQVLKKTINMGQNMDLGSATSFEIESFIISFNSEDRVEGINALLEKRKPNFKGR
ncbi:MAG: enoyl-CoA hydratase/isomerase family protein [Dethiobacteria bacterium]|jgi:enoyl-CoA hydratase